MTLPAALGRLVAVIGGLQAALWLGSPTTLLRILPGVLPTKPSSSLALLLIGTVLGFRLVAPVRRAFLAGAGILAVEGVVAQLLDRPLLTSAGLYPAAWQPVHLDGRMALATAVVLLALVAGVLIAARRPTVATLLGVLGFVLGLVSLVGHLYGVAALTTTESATAMPAPTAVACVLAACSMLTRDPGLLVSRALRDEGAAGSLFRQLVMPAMVTPVLVGLAIIQAERWGTFDAAYGQGLLVLVLTVGTIAVVLLAARTASRAETGRAVAEDRERLRFVLDSTPVGIVEVDARGNRSYANRRWTELTGRDEGSMADPFEIVHPEDRAALSAAWSAAVDAGEDFASRYRYLRADGSTIWVSSRATALKNRHGKTDRWLVTVTDITENVEAQHRLEDSERRYRSVVATMAEGVVLQGRDGAIVTANEAASRLLGLSTEQLRGLTSVDPRWRAVHEDGSDFPGAEHPPMVALATGQPVRGVTMGVHRPDGSLVWLEISSEPLVEPGPAGADVVSAAVTTFSDVTATRAAARALARSEEQFRSAMEHAPIGMALVHLDGTFMEVNRALCRLVGYDETELLGRSLQQITHPDDIEGDLDSLSRLRGGSVDHYTVEKRYITRSGEVVWVLLAVSMARDEDHRPSHFIAQIQDISSSREEQQQLAHRAMHDPLTGLANRDLLMDRIDHALARSRRTDRSDRATMVLFCDLDRFKEVNDTYGHEVGDLVLLTVADRLRGVVRPSDTVSRLGGDEFVVVAEGVPHDLEQRALADRVRAALDEPLHVAGHVVRSGASIGVAVAREGDDARSLLREADAAMYRVKARSRAGYVAG